MLPSMNLCKLPIFILLLVYHTITGNSHLAAQEIYEHNFFHYNLQQGLSHNLVNGIAQDSTGYIWMATSWGLNRFNGTDFVQFHSGNHHNSLPEEYLTGLVWLNKEKLAAISNSGLHIINTVTGEANNLFIPYKNKQYQYKFNTLMAVNSNSAGDLFLLTRSGFYHFDKNYRLLFRFDYYASDKVANTVFTFGRQMLFLDEQRIAVISSAGIYCYQAEKKQLNKINQVNCPELKEFVDYPQTDLVFFPVKQGRFFVMNLEADSLYFYNIQENKRKVTRLPISNPATEFGYRSRLSVISDTLFYLTGHLSGFYQISIDPTSDELTFHPKKYFASYYCSQLIKDKSNHLWVATNNGVLREDSNRPYIIQSSIPSSLLTQYPNLTTGDLYADSQFLYVVTRGGAGLLLFNKELTYIRNISFEGFWRDPKNIHSVEAVNDHRLLAGINGPLCWFNPKTGRITEIRLSNWSRDSNWVADLFTDRHQNIWIASKQIYKYDAATQQFSMLPSRGIPLDKIVWPKNIQQDASGNIWISGHGLIRYHVKTKTFDRLLDSFPYIKIPDKQVNSFIADHYNNLWINSNNNGLICYSIQDKTFRHFTRDDGLPDHNIASMIIIGDNLWIATYAGIASLDLRTYRITSFGKEDGFPSEPISNGASFFYDTLHNKLHIGFSHTIVQFDPNIISQKSQAPSLFIESIISNNQTKYVSGCNNFETSWRNNEIKLTIGTINFFTGKSERFAYRFVNDEPSQWQELGNNNSFSISNLSPGNHRIQIKVFSCTNRWPEQIRDVNINILPPIWKQTWFRLLAVLLLVFLLYSLSNRRMAVIRKKERAKTHIQELKAENYKNLYKLEQISNYFSSSLSDKITEEEVLWDVAKNLIGKMNYMDCMIYLWNSDKTKMIQKASYGPKGTPKAIICNQFDVSPGQGVVGYVMETKEPLLIPDTRLDDRYRVDDINRLSELCVPIIHNNELIGIFDSEHPDADYFKERDIQILTTIATLVGNKLKQIESERSLEIKQKEIAFINQQLAEAQLSALQTQMNPHFIFNSLNAIKRMILVNEQQNASRYLSKFAQLIRSTLNQSKESFTTLRENIEHLENYLLMEKLRFDDSFTFQIIIDDHIDTEETLLPTFMIQPLAENAIWHGLMPQEGEKKLVISFSMQEEIISCAIEDNGIGIIRSEELKRFSRQHHKSVGLDNLRNRIKILNEKYETDCTLELTDLHQYDDNKTGTRAVIQINTIKIKLPI